MSRDGTRGNAHGEEGTPTTTEAKEFPANETGPLVSILIPAYNAERFIADAVRSALAQTWRPIEVIVADDGSTDKTLSIAKALQSDTVRVVSLQHKGAAAARNYAFSLSRGEYIQWLDADDFMEPDKIARQMRAVRDCGSKRTLLSGAFGTCRSRYYRANFVPTALWQDLSPVEWLAHKMGSNLYMSTAGWLVSRELSQAAGPWNNGIAADDDGEYFSRVILNAKSVMFVPGARVYYRLHSRNSLSYRGLSNLDGQWVSAELHVRYLLGLEDSEKTRAACLRYLQNQIPYFYPERMDIFERARELARKLGGEMVIPSLPRKYAWIMKLFGWRTVKRARRLLPAIRWSMTGWLDSALYHRDRLLLRDRLPGIAGRQPG